MADTQRTPGSISAHDALPPIEPPSAGFLVQLFVIPGVIVAIIVVVWLLFHWLASMGNDPREYIKKLRGNSEVRWQAAVNLAGALQGEAGDEIKHDSAVATDLGQILKDEIAQGSTEERPINLRVYLCRALGEFKTPAALPALLDAVKTQRDDEEIDVRRAAVHGIASLAANFKQAKIDWDQAEAVAALIAASKSDNANLRAEAAFALGLFDQPEALARLDAMLEDSHPDARFNAATGLARHGKIAALPVLLEMLDPDQTLSTHEERPEDRAEKAVMVHVNGLRALAELSKISPSADLSSAMPAVEWLCQSKLVDVKQNAIEVRRILNEQERTKQVQSVH
jgi:HEAT repeat protein